MQTPFSASDFTYPISLDPYGFSRTEYCPIEHVPENKTRFNDMNIEYLTANGENGGLVLLTGTGFQYHFSDDNWRDKNTRQACEGLRLFCPDYHSDPGHLSEGKEPTDYRQTLDLKDGMVCTKMGFGADKTGYKTALFPALHNKHLISLTLTNTEKDARVWTVLLPEYQYTVTEDPADPRRILQGVQDGEGYYTKTAWCFRSSKPLSGRKITLEPGETAEFRFTFTADRGEGADYRNVAREALEPSVSYADLLKKHRAAWARYWAETPVVLTPDEEVNRLYYRSLYWNACQNGSEKFLAMEAGFASLRPDCSDVWHGHSFSYGSPGFAVTTFLMTGHSRAARKILELMYRPEELARNAYWYTDIEGALSFAHENNINGKEISPGFWGNQRHINGFVADLFRTYRQYCPDDREFFEQRVYPVFRGVAQFYRGCLIWNEEQKAYLLPRWLSVSEIYVARPNVLDAALNALFSLKQAAEYARELNVDADLAAEWDRMADQIEIPQNDEIYLQYHGDPATADDGGGYFGKRAQLYLGIPYLIDRGQIDPEKAKRTLLSAWEDNRGGDGMISFIAGWGARTAAQFGMGDLALEMLEHYFRCSPGFICETPHGVPYFQSHCCYVQALLSMLVQGNDRTIRCFPAVPARWKQIRFDNVTTIDGIKVSGVWENGEIKSVTYRSAAGKQLLQTQDAAVRVEIDPKTGERSVTNARR